MLIIWKVLYKSLNRWDEISHLPHVASPVCCHPYVFSQLPYAICRQSYAIANRMKMLERRPATEAISMPYLPLPLSWNDPAETANPGKQPALLHKRQRPCTNYHKV